MAYVALYRKFRPDTFEEVKGQEHIVTTLKNQIKHDRIGHAYLFCGTRGTGKTSVAKLLAKAVNCEHPVDGSPCGTCDSCRKIASGAAMNVLEIDAASNNGVDNIRQINEGVQYAPTDGKYMVYIIDEVHMLSSGAFNAMLKTLEEPPSYVIFILATTESHKVPVTIRSRCQRYDFRRIEYQTISDRMQDLLERENVPATKEALDYIARAADGSMRDALSILDECVSYHLGEELTLDRVLSTIGAVDTEIYEQLTRKIAEDDPVAVMELIHDVIWKGMDLTRFTDDYLWFLRNLLFLVLSPGLGSQLDLTTDKIKEMEELGKLFSKETLQRHLNVMQELAQEIRGSSTKRVTLEMGMIRLMRPETGVDLESVLGRLERLEKRAEQAEAEVVRLTEMTEKLKSLPPSVNVQPAAGNAEQASEQAEADALSAEEKRAKIKLLLPEEKVEAVMELSKQWNSKILHSLSMEEMKYAKNYRLVVDETPLADFWLDFGQNTTLRKIFDSDGHLNRLSEEVEELTGQKFKFRLGSDTDSKNDGTKLFLDELNMVFDNIEVC